MRLWVAHTDGDWFEFVRGAPPLDEVNFWRPSNRGFAALKPGEIFLFKLHAPRNVIVGGGFFLRADHLPVHLAWETFGRANGASTEWEMLERIRRYRRGEAVGLSDQITCIVLSEPFFFSEPIAVPASFSRFAQVGQAFGLESDEGRDLFRSVEKCLSSAVRPAPGAATWNILDAPRFGPPRVVTPRMGQGGFSLSIRDVYNKRCAITGERTVPVLEAAHIRPYSDGGQHELRNGLLLRRDLHTLFDLGYLGVDPDSRRVMVSPRIKAEFENGRDYYSLQGVALRPPNLPEALPADEYLRYHASVTFKS